MKEVSSVFKWYPRVVYYKLSSVIDKKKVKQYIGLTWPEITFLVGIALVFRMVVKYFVNLNPVCY